MPIPQNYQNHPALQRSHLMSLINPQNIASVRLPAFTSKFLIRTVLGERQLQHPIVDFLKKSGI